tara:strand:- start:20905 stop:21411 length:507 start_codon:yes stop_codon:yes gene_type:complete
MKKAIIVTCVISILTFSSFVEAKKGVGSLLRGLRGIESINGVKNYSYNTLTLENLKKCILKNESLNTEFAKMSIIEENLEKYKVKLDNMEYKLNNKQLFNFYDQKDVDNYNNLMINYNNLILDFNRQLTIYTPAAEKYNTETIEYNIMCGDKRYYEDDYEIIKKELKL